MVLVLNSLNERCGGTHDGLLLTGFNGRVSPVLSLPRTNHWSRISILRDRSPSQSPLSSTPLHSISVLLASQSLSVAGEIPHSCREKERINQRIKPSNYSYKSDMACSRFSFGFGVVAMIATLIFAIFMPSAVHAQSPAPVPAPISDGSSIDQGIAYMLMLMALVLTYLIHSPDLYSSF